MNFYDQTPEMKRTLLQSTVGGVTIAANDLESTLKLIVEIQESLDGMSNVKNTKKFVSLGSTIQRARKLTIFNEEDIALLKKAKSIRNDFMHELSTKYINSINDDGSMYELLTEFKCIWKDISIAVDLLHKKLDEMAILGGADTVKFKQNARNAILDWEKK